MMSRSSCLLLVTLTLTLTLALVAPTCHAYTYNLISKSLPKGSYYIENQLTSKELSPLAGALKSQSINATAGSTADTDISVTTAGNGLFAIVSTDPYTKGSYCVIRVLDADSSTIQNNGIACTLAPSLMSARVQAEPSSTMCNPTNPCTQSVVGTLAIDSTPTTTTTTTQTDPNANNMGAMVGSMGTPSTVIIIAAVGSVGGMLLIILGVVGACTYRSRAYKRVPPQSSINWAVPGAITETRSRPTSTHVRSETAQNFQVNPVQFSVAVDMDQPAYSRPYQPNMMRQ